MPRKKSLNPSTTSNISDQAFQVLMKEYDTLKDLFSQTETAIQSIFNFYVTLISAVVGGIALIYQLTATPAYASRTNLITCALLMLAATVGTIYLLALTARYARLIQYSQTLDTLRSFLITTLNIPLPEIYSRFLQRAPNPTPAFNLHTFLRALTWLLPTGTYQLTMAFINSLVITLATTMLLALYGEPGASLTDHLAVFIIEFAVTFNLYNLYSRWIMSRWVSEFDLQINPQRDDPFHMIR